MEGVGARLGRSSTRYGPAVVFSGRVRKWKKRWVHVSPSASDPSSNSKHGSANGGGSHSQMRSLNGSVSSNGGSNGSNLLLYKWTPLSQSNSNGNGTGDAINNGHDTSPAAEEPPKRRFKFVPIAVLEEQKNDEVENEIDDEEAKPSDADPSGAELNFRSKGLNEKPDINDMPMEEAQENNQSIRQDLNESTLDLSLG